MFEGHAESLRHKYFHSIITIRYARAGDRSYTSLDNSWLLFDQCFCGLVYISRCMCGVCVCVFRMLRREFLRKHNDQPHMFRKWKPRVLGRRVIWHICIYIFLRR